MLTAAQRLNEVLRITGTNVKSLSERLGYSRPQGLYDVAAGRTKNISADLCRKIVTAFPEFNQAWLLAGEGEMLSDPGDQSRKPELGDVVLSGDMVKLFINMTETIKRQEDNISVLTAMVDRLTGGKSQE